VCNMALGFGKNRGPTRLGCDHQLYTMDPRSLSLSLSCPLLNTPISLLHSEFARFQDAMRSAPLDPSLAPLAWRYATELSKVFEHEKEREEEFHELVAELLVNPVTIDKVLFGRCQTDGTVYHPDIIPDLPAMPADLKVKYETMEGTTDGASENIFYYQEGVRHILTSKNFSVVIKHTRLPSVLIQHNGRYEQIMGDLGSDTSTGPNIQISGATCLSFKNLISRSLALRSRCTSIASTTAPWKIS
jgi:hypothetical protein